MSDSEAGLDFGAVFKGAVVGAVASLIESTVLGMVFLPGTPKSPAEAETMMKALMASQSYLLTDLGASLFCMAIGGYVAAGSAQRAGLVHGGITGALLMCFVGAMYSMSPHLTPGWYTGATFILIIPAAAVGGLMRGV